MKRNIIKMIAVLLAFVLLLSGLPTQIAQARERNCWKSSPMRTAAILRSRWRTCRRPERLAP